MNKVKYIVLILSFLIFSSCETKKEDNSSILKNEKTELDNKDINEYYSTIINNDSEDYKYYLVNYNFIYGNVEDIIGIDSNSFFNCFYFIDRLNKNEIILKGRDVFLEYNLLPYDYKPFFIEVKPKSSLYLFISLKNNRYKELKAGLIFMANLKYTLKESMIKFNLPYYCNLDTFNLELSTNGIFGNSPKINIDLFTRREYQKVLLINEMITLTPQNQP